MPLSSHVLLHCSRITLCHSKLSIFPLLFARYKIVPNSSNKPKPGTNHFKFKPLCGFHNRTQCDITFALANISPRLGVISPQRKLRYHRRSLCACGLPQISQRRSRYITGGAPPPSLHHKVRYSTWLKPRITPIAMYLFFLSRERNLLSSTHSSSVRFDCTSLSSDCLISV